MIRNKRITLIIPCKNEGTALRTLLGTVPAFVDEVLVIDNGSTDNTVAVGRSLGAKVISEKRHDAKGIGYGFAHQTGILQASGDIIVTMDGDGTYPMDAIRPAVTQLLQKKLDLLSCTRYPLVQKTAVSPIRQLGVRILNLEVSLLFGYPMHDILTGMWVGSTSALRELQLVEGGWNLSPEIKLKAISNPTFAFGEFHILHKHRGGGVSKQAIWITGFDHLFYILRFALQFHLQKAWQGIQGLSKGIRDLSRRIKTATMMMTAKLAE